MHQPGPGAALKNIEGRPPPVSLYTALPRAFGFRPVADAPAFLTCRRRVLRAFRRRGAPKFWRLDFPSPGDR